MNEQRADKRVAVAVDVTVETRHNFYAGITGDMSHGGVFVVTDEPMAPGSQVSVDISLPDGGRVRAQGCVRWVRPPEVATEDCPAGCGIAWQAIDRRSLSAVRRFLARQARRDLRVMAKAA